MAKRLFDVLKKNAGEGKPGSTKVVPNQAGYTPKPKDEKDFAALHVVDRHDSQLGNGDDVFKGDTKTYNRSPDRMGYNPGEDKKAYHGNAPDKNVGEEMDEGEVVKFPVGRNNPNWGHTNHGNAKIVPLKKKTSEKNEEVLDELSKKTLGSYVKKASADSSYQSGLAGYSQGKIEHTKGDWLKSVRTKNMKDAEVKSYNRHQGIKKAVDKITKEEVLDELSKKTLGAYVKAGHRDMRGRGQDEILDNSNKHFDTLKKTMKRRKYLDKAVDRLTKEEALPLRSIIESDWLSRGAVGYPDPPSKPVHEYHETLMNFHNQKKNEANHAMDHHLKVAKEGTPDVAAAAEEMIKHFSRLAVLHAAREKLHHTMLKSTHEEIDEDIYEDVLAEKNWIAGATRNKGALHRKLGVPEGQKIPAKKLAAASHSSDPTERKEANLAKTLKGLHHKEEVEVVDEGIPFPIHPALKLNSKGKLRPRTIKAIMKDKTDWQGKSERARGNPEYNVMRQEQEVNEEDPSLAGDFANRYSNSKNKKFEKVNKTERLKKALHVYFSADKNLIK